MNEKSYNTYCFLLDHLESGKWDEGTKVPGARKLAVEAGCGFPLMQTVIEILCQQGILVTKARSGTYVSENWRHRILANNLCIHSRAMKKLVKGCNPLPDKLRVTDNFHKGMFEIIVSHYVLSHHEDFMDLSEVFEELFPDKNDFYLNAVKPFYVGKKLCGVPFIFSPRIMLCNREFFKKASCPLPDENWSWQEFIETLECLQRAFPNKPLLNLHYGIFVWATMLFRFGGQIYVPEDEDPVKLDSPCSIKAIQEYSKLIRRFMSNEIFSYYNFEQAKEYPLFLVPRQNLFPALDSIINEMMYPVKLPMPAGGVDTNNQAVELLCVRKECSDMALVKEYIKSFLSSEVQESIGKVGYGLPIRKSAAEKVKPQNSPAADLYYSEISNISSDYHIFSPELYRMISSGVSLILHETEDSKIADSLHELSQALRMFIKIEKFADRL